MHFDALHGRFDLLCLSCSFYGDRETVRFSGGKIIIRKKKGRRKKGEGRVCGMCTMYTCIWHMYACVGCPVD